MLPHIVRNLHPETRKDINPVNRRQPVLVYNARVENLLEELVVDCETVSELSLTADWMQFMTHLNSEMFDRISL